MKKLFAFLLVVVMILSMMVGCGNNTTPGNDTDTKKIETLKVAFVPSREPAEIITVTEPLKAMLKEELAKEGYEVGEVEITVGTTYEAVGEGHPGWPVHRFRQRQGLERWPAHRSFRKAGCFLSCSHDCRPLR